MNGHTWAQEEERLLEGNGGPRPGEARKRKARGLVRKGRQRGGGG